MRDKFKYYTSNRTPYDMAVYRVAQIRRFYVHLFIFGIVLGIYILKNYFGAALNFIPFEFINLTVISIWGLIIGIKAVKLFSQELFFGKKWEDRKMDEFMGKEKTTKWE